MPFLPDRLRAPGGYSVRGRVLAGISRPPAPVPWTLPAHPQSARGDTGRSSRGRHRTLVHQRTTSSQGRGAGVGRGRIVRGHQQSGEPERSAPAYPCSAAAEERRAPWILLAPREIPGRRRDGNGAERAGASCKASQDIIAADEHRSTPIGTKRLIRVDRRSSAAEFLFGTLV